MLKNMTFCHLQENLEINMVKKLMHTTVKTGIDATKTASKRVIQKTAEATGDLIGNKIVDIAFGAVCRCSSGLTLGAS